MTRNGPATLAIMVRIHARFALLLATFLLTVLVDLTVAIEVGMVPKRMNTLVMR